VKRCRLRVAQEVRDLGNRERCIREVAFGGVPSRQIDQFLVASARATASIRISPPATRDVSARLTSSTVPRSVGRRASIAFA
jgi:hypothetical protein